jgi:hypothetical protein
LDKVKLRERVLAQFTVQFNQGVAGQDSVRESEIVGALVGFLASAAPDITTAIETRLLSDKNERPDFVLTSSKERLILEVKRALRPYHDILNIAIPQVMVMAYLQSSGLTQAVLYLFGFPNTGKIVFDTFNLVGSQNHIIVVATESM